jgi:hypothetical protein
MPNRLPNQSNLKMLFKTFYYINQFLLIVVLIVGLYRLRNIKEIYYFYIVSIFLADVTNIFFLFIKDLFFYKALDLFDDFSHNVLIYLFFTVTHLRKQKRNIFFAVLFTIFILDVSNIFINLNYTVYPNNYLNYCSVIVLLIVLFQRLISSYASNEFYYRISKAELLILIPKIIYLVYDILLGILMIFLFNNHTKQLFMNLFTLITFICICSSILAIIALINAPKREKYA